MDDVTRAFAAKLGLDPDHLPLVLDIPVAGKAADLSRPRSYAAAADGSMPTIKLAGRKILCQRTNGSKSYLATRPLEPCRQRKPGARVMTAAGQKHVKRN